MMEIGSGLDKVLAAAQPNVVFGQPIESNGRTVITASEVMAGGGFGYGSGQAEGEGGTGGGSGGGGGGGSRGRPVAVISIGPDGVKVQPIFDMTTLGLAAITAWGAMALALMRMGSRQR